MKITIVQGAFLPVPPLMGGAVEKVWFQLGQEFVKHGHEVSHLSRSYQGLPDHEQIKGVQHRRIPGFNTPKSLITLKALDLIYSLRIARRLPAADILVTNTFWLPMLVRSSKFGKLYVHAARYPKGQMKYYRHAGRIQTVSRPIAEAIEKEAPFIQGQVSSIPYPIPFSTCYQSDLKRRNEVLYVGRIHPEKGVHLLVQAFAALPESLRNEWRLVIVGPSETKLGGGGSDYEDLLKTMAAPLRQQVEWVGPVFDQEGLLAYYQRASLFVYPSLAERGETFGLAPLEAMSQGCPSFVSSLECFRDFIDDGINGFVFNHRSPDPGQTLAKQLAGLLTQPDLLAAAGKKAYFKSLDYQLKPVAEMYLEDFKSCLAEGP